MAVGGDDGISYRSAITGIVAGEIGSAVATGPTGAGTTRHGSTTPNASIGGCGACWLEVCIPKTIAITPVTAITAAITAKKVRRRVGLIEEGSN
jgi:hypothetical protein